MKPPLSLEAFLDWVETKPPEEEYVFHSWVNCACAQYAKFLGVEWLTKSCPADDFWEMANRISHRNYRHPSFRTFGGLAEILREEIKCV